MRSMGTETGWVHTSVFPDRGYANVDISGIEYNLDRDSVQSHLCQTCLDSINGEWFGDDPPAELAVVNYAEKTVRPLIACTTGFGAGNFYVDCDFKEDGEIDLLMFYCYQDINKNTISVNGADGCVILDKYIFDF